MLLGYTKKKTILIIFGHRFKHCGISFLVQPGRSPGIEMLLSAPGIRQKCTQQQKWQKRENVGEFGKYGENDNFATIADKAKHKAVKGAHKSFGSAQGPSRRKP